jgi:tRNA U34 5-methylaminomethyl-2-thiouridine-forming methyltransferase MnmC
MVRNIIETEDGSSSLYIPDLNESYHSTHGAIQESTHIYINCGLKQIDKEEIKIFEMGYGTGLNFILTYLNAKNKFLNYHSIEAYPLDNSLIKQLNYPQVLTLTPELTNLFYQFHSTNGYAQLSKNCTVNLTKCKLNEYTAAEQFDIIYYDAFAPKIQPHLWTLEVFQKMFDMLVSGGHLLTYCSKGEVRRNMQQCGFKVEKLPGPPMKREIIRATKPI